MRKAYRRLFNIAFLGFSVLMLTLCLTMTFAFFTDTVTISGSVSIGRLSVAVKVNGTSYTSDNSYSSAVFNTDTAMPGDNITGDVSIVPTFSLSDGNGIYARIKVTATVTPASAGSLTVNNNSNWTLNLSGHDTGYYYYTGGGSTLKAITTSGSEIAFCTGVIIPASMTNQSTTISLAITAETTQAGFQESDIVWGGVNNLFINGDGSFGDNTNWTELTYSTDSTSPTGTALSYSAVGSSSKTIYSGNYVPVDNTQTYELSVHAKDTAGTNTYYLGLVQYDIDRLEISPRYCLWQNGSTTRLAKDLKNGDTVVYLEDVSGFTNKSYYYQMGFIIWDYKDSTGYQYPKHTYSRNVYWGNATTFLFDYDDIDFTNNTITLNSAWTGGSHSAGVDISQCSNGATFNYCLRSNTALTTSWTQYSATISGYGTTYNAAITHGVFRQGTKYVRFGMSRTANSSNTGTVTTSFTNISIKKV